MPIYEYRCENGHTFEVMQRISDGPLEACQVCGAPVQRVFHPIAVHFKGKGFYNTDYGTRKRQRELKDAADGGSSSSGSDSGSSDGAKKSDAPAKSGSDGGSSSSGSSSDGGSKKGSGATAS